MFTDDEKNILLSAARQSIETLFLKDVSPAVDASNSPALKQPCGVFVTLTNSGDLRGCIGFIRSEKPLFETVCEAAELAATEDSRFFPIAKKELPDLHIEISVLSPFHAISSYDEITIGTHGVFVRTGRANGLLLPQVAVEHKMNRDEFLSALCQKAGLPGNEWKSKFLPIQVFTADIFHENELHNSDSLSADSGTESAK